MTAPFALGDDLTDRTFLRVTDPSTSILVILNVIVGTWQEGPIEKMGTARRAFAGNLLSTERTPKRAYSCTAEFLTAASYDAFLALISDSAAGLGIPKIVSVNGGPLSGMRGQLVSCRIWVGQVSASEQILPPYGQPSSVYQVPLTIREI